MTGTPPCQGLLVHHEPDGVLRLTLDRPDRLNAIDAGTGSALLRAFTVTAIDPEVRAVLLTGTGRAFCAGADLSTGTEWVSAATMSDVVKAVLELPKPVITAVRGAAAGVGCSLALASDLAVLSDDAYMLLAFTRVGLMPDGGATELLAASIGRARALQLCLLAERLPAAEARAAGLVAEVVPEERLDAHAAALAARLARGATAAFAATKAAINSSSIPTIAEALDREVVGQSALLATRDFAEGQRAFEERREPNFTGA